MYAMGYWSKIGFIGQRVTGQILLLITGTVTWIIRSNGLEIELGLMPDVLLWINTTLIRWKTVKTVLRAVRQYAQKSCGPGRPETRQMRRLVARIIISSLSLQRSDMARV